MQQVKISELKARLSSYIRLVENGEDVLVMDRQRPVARIVAPEPRTHRLQITPARLTLEEGRRLLAAIPRPRLSKKIADKTLRWMKEDRTKQWLPNKRNSTRTSTHR